MSMLCKKFAALCIQFGVSQIIVLFFGMSLLSISSLYSVASGADEMLSILCGDKKCVIKKKSVVTARNVDKITKSSFMSKHLFFHLK